jgi:hypothetical protein
MVSVLFYWPRKSNRPVAAIQKNKASLFVTNDCRLAFLIKILIDMNDAPWLTNNRAGM